MLAILLVAAITQSHVRPLITPLDKVDNAGIQRLKALGPDVVPPLVAIYRDSNENDRAVVAWILYSLGFKSTEARAALLEDIHTKNEKLRLQVQWALGRVSDDTEVVDILYNIMRNDPNATFRDKAACALAYDQIHLTPKQKVLLYAKLIDALSDDKPQVRMIAITALRIHTGQTKGFEPGAPAEERTNAIGRWKAWLSEYQKNL
ncbi:MAG TPA: HEAT repeat domain-containing protein [Thermoanaerobaculia bacterium]|nr:HEAT repeat domain-containing protein [Thermoanaerobaculia bacterium]